jgi:hypothetical protein
MKQREQHKKIGECEAQSASDAYQRTPAELDLVTRQRQRRDRQSPAPTVTVQHKPPRPVKIDADHSDKSLWSHKLKASMGTTEWSFANKILRELINSACAGSNSKPLAEEDVNAAVAAMHGIAPRDEAEAMLAAQMIATHSAAMTVLQRLKGCETITQQDSAGNLANKLLRSYAAQLEALARYRGKGQQKVVVEHVHVHPGGQAIVGSVNATPRQGGGGTNEIERQPHAIAHTPRETLPSAIEAHRETVPVASG